MAFRRVIIRRVGPLSWLLDRMKTLKHLRVTEQNDWVIAIGRYILNMGSVEATTRVLIAIHEKSDQARVMNADLSGRIGFLRNRFPRVDNARHSWAMNVFNVTSKHAGFRNIIAHSPLLMTGSEDEPKVIQGILNITPNDDTNFGVLIGLDELKNRVEESAIIGENLVSMQIDFATS
jgi:hypothetical protein